MNKDLHKIYSDFSYNEVKEHIYPFIRNHFSGEPSNLEHTKKLIMEYPGIPTNGIWVFFAINMGGVIPIEDVVEPITFTMMRAWNISTVELYHTAFHNLDKLPLRLSAIYKDQIYLMDSSSKKFPNYENSRFLSKNVLRQIHKQLDDDFYIFPASVWSTYLIRVRDSQNMDPSTLLVYTISKVGRHPDTLLRHGYKYEGGKLNIVEFTASRKKTEEKLSDKIVKIDSFGEKV